MVKLSYRLSVSMNQELKNIKWSAILHREMGYEGEKIITN